MSRRFIWILSSVTFLLVSFISYADELGKRVTVVDNLEPIAKLAKQKQLPVMVFFAAEDCEFCEYLEADYLAAMSKSSEYKNKVIIRKVMIDGFDDIYDFQGNNTSPEDFIEQFKVRVTPTLLLVNHQGSKLTRNIVGYNRSGFFGAYLDEAINEANQKVKEI